MVTNRQLLDPSRVYYHLSDAVTHAYERAAFFGREAIVAIRMGQAEHARHAAMIAHRWAVETGRVWREPDADEVQRAMLG